MASFSEFIEPDSSNSESLALAFFPKFKTTDAVWLYGLLRDELRHEDADDSIQIEAQQEFLRLKAHSFTLNAPDCLRFEVLFYPAKLDTFCDQTILHAEREAFDWSAFFSTRGGAEHFVNTGAFFLNDYIGQYPAFADAWRNVSLERRIRCYRHGVFSSIPDLITRYEGLRNGLRFSLEDLDELKYGPDVFTALCDVRNGSLPTGLDQLPTFGDDETLRREFVLAVQPATAQILDHIYAAADLMQIAIELDAIFNNNPKMDRNEDAAREAWEFFIRRISVATPHEATKAVLAILTGSGNSCPCYFGSYHAEATFDAAKEVALFILRPENLCVIHEELVASRNMRRRDSFTQAVLEELDAAVSSELRLEYIVLYTLWIRLFLDEEDPLAGLSTSRSFSPMVVKASCMPDGIEQLLGLPALAGWDPFEELAWKAAVIQSALSNKQLFPEMSDAVADERNKLCREAADLDGNISCPIALFLPKSERTEAFNGRLLNDRLEAYLNGSEIYFSYEAMVLAFAIAIADRRSIAFVEGRYAKNWDPHSVFVGAAYIAYLSGQDGVSDEQIIAFMRRFKMIDIKKHYRLGKLVKNKNTLAAATFEEWLGNASRASSNSDILFVRCIEEILGDEATTAAFIKERIFELASGDAEARIAAIRLADVLGRRFGDALKADQALFELVKSIAATFFDELRKRVRAGASGDELSGALYAVKSAARCLEKTKGEVPAIKQLLLIFRHFSVVSLGPDLNPYAGSEVEPWSRIPQAIHETLDRKWESETGKELRRALSHDFLEYLKPRKGAVRKDGQDNQRIGWTPGYDQGITEPDPVWRYAYVRAVADLGADPMGNRHFHHQILNKVSVHDPSPKVQKAAKLASDEISSRTGWKPGSNKRLLLNAWWWLRQAHMITTGGMLDRDAALRRRDTEIRM